MRSDVIDDVDDDVDSIVGGLSDNTKGKDS